jgi:hypothetical protein
MLGQSLGRDEGGQKTVWENSNHASTCFITTSAPARDSRPTTATETNAEASSLAVNQTRHVTRIARIPGGGC